MSRDLGPDIAGSEKLYARKLSADFPSPILKMFAPPQKRFRANFALQTCHLTVSSEVPKKSCSTIVSQSAHFCKSFFP